MSTRTTVPLDEDVLERVKQVSQASGVSLDEMLNELLRFALAHRNEQPARKPFKVRATAAGLRPGLSYDNIEALLEYAEGPYHR